MTNRLNAVLYIQYNGELLSVWLDYHKHYFDAGTVVLATENREEQERIVRRIMPDWKISDHFPFQTSHYEEDKTSGNGTYHLILSDTEFLIDANKDDIIKHCRTGRLNANCTVVREIPNNVMEFLDRLSEPNEYSTVSFPIKFLGSSTDDYIDRIRKNIKSRGYIYYLDAFIHSDCTWGEDRVILAEDTNLLEHTDFNAKGHAIFKMERDYQPFLKRLVETKIEEITSRRIDAGEYHLHITGEEHTKIINAMPYKRSETAEMNEFATYFEKRVSDILKIPVKIFNDDIWIRICRPSSHSKNDYNPCHRDIYLDFYRNIVNIYLPIVGSNSVSSLAMQSGSHLWNEHDVIMTKGGAYFPSSNKKYSVDAVLQSRTPLDMVRPNPSTDEFILFSPYLIHGCSSNENSDITRMSVEIRFICDTEMGRNQETIFREFLEKRVWR